MGDGRTIEVQFYDYLDTSDPGMFGETGEEGEPEDLGTPRMIDVIVEGALEYSDSYNADDATDVRRAKRDLIKAWGPVAKDWLG